MTPLLAITSLQVTYRARGRTTLAVRDVTLAVAPGESVGIAGESGSGKSTVARTILGLLPPGIGQITAGQIHIEGQDVTTFTDAQWTALRGHPVAMVFQDPLSFLNPVMSVGAQVAESVRRHDRNTAIRPRCVELLDLVALPPETLRRYPHELSGGMRQRVMLAIALGCRPRLLVADEPTTALDVTTQAEIMTLLGTLRRKLGMGLVIISHDLGLLRWHTDQVAVMYAGRTIEWGPTAAVLTNPLHPYASGLIAASRLQRGPDGRFGALRDGPLSPGAEGCPFTPRCPQALPICASQMPPIFHQTHQARCWQLDPAHDAA